MTLNALGLAKWDSYHFLGWIRSHRKGRFKMRMYEEYGFGYVELRDAH